MPADGPLDLFGMDEGDGSDPVAPDGHLRAEWVSGGWSDNPERMARWAGAGPHGGRAAAGGAGRAGRPADGRRDGPLRVHRRTAVRGAVRGRAADGPGGRGAGPDLLYRPPAAQRGRSRGPAGGPRRGGAAARACGCHRRPAQPGPGAIAAGQGRRGRAGHPGLAAAGDAGRASAGRRAARVAEGGADRHHVRIRVAGCASRRRRAAARRVDRLGRRGGPDDRVGGPAQHARPRCARRSWPPTGTCSSGPTWARSSRGCWPRCPGIRRWWRRPGPTICTRRWRRSSAWTGRSPRSRSSARCTGRPPATAPRRCAACQRGLSGGDGLPRRRRPGRAGRP